MLKFRLHAIRKLPLEQRARRARALIEHRANAELAYELFGSYLMASCKELVTEFLDATGVRHEEGMIDTLQGNEPAKEKLQEAIAALDERHEPADVTLYLSLCAEQWPSVPELDSLWRLRG